MVNETGTVATHPYDPRERVVEAARLLNYFLLDLVVGTRGIEIFDHPAIAPNVTHSIAIGLNRMAVSHLVVTLSKWSELYRRYAAVLPTDVRDACRTLNKQIEGRGIVNFRNTVVGHILDDKTQRPLTPQEIDIRLNHAVGDDLAHFIRWINDPQGNSFSLTVVAITEHVRDRLRTDYGLRDDEIV